MSETITILRHGEEIYRVTLGTPALVVLGAVVAMIFAAIVVGAITRTP